MSTHVVNLPVDLNSEDASGLPWGLLSQARKPRHLREGAWIVVGNAHVQAVAQVANIDGDVVHVRPLRGPSSKRRALLSVPAQAAPHTGRDQPHGLSLLAATGAATRQLPAVWELSPQPPAQELRPQDRFTCQGVPDV